MRTFSFLVFRLILHPSAFVLPTVPPSISIRNLGKRYRVNHAQERVPYRTLRDSLSRSLAAPLRRMRAGANGAAEDFWALKDVSFEIAPGEVVGVIGRNGAGKSTLLKILSRITKPTTGEVEINGRVGSLLEVGTGFHPELTGRENMYMNGSILGMSRREIRRRFDEIVAFAEIDRFLDTPVKRYSSGMYVRLAFAVAAHLEPEVLLVDEVLAVGDMAFQQKCIGKMRDVSNQGRTILFVSHNMGSLVTLCDKAVRLEQGAVVGYGDCSSQVSSYISSLHRICDTSLLSRTDRSGSGVMRLARIRFEDRVGEAVEHILAGDALHVLLDYVADGPIANVSAHLAFYNDLGTPVTYLSSTYSGDCLPLLPVRGTLRCAIPELALAPGNYLLNACLQTDSRDADHIAGAASIKIIPGHFFPTGKTPPSSFGHVLCRHRWEVLAKAGSTTD